MSKSVTFCLPASNAPRNLPRSSFVPPKSTWPVRTQTVPSTPSSTQSTSSSIAPVSTASSEALTTSVSVLPSKGAYPQAIAVSSGPVRSSSPYVPMSSSQPIQGSPLTHVSTTSHDQDRKGSCTSPYSTEGGYFGSKSRVDPTANTSLNLSKVCKVAEQVRKQTNSASHDMVRTAKYEVSRMHEYLLKVEEEIKLTNKARHTLEVAVQDIRKSISLNQQTISSQQKKARGSEDVIVKLLREEARTLSRSKWDLEGHLHTIRHHLHMLDTTKKQLQSKIADMSKSLELDAQSFRVYYRRNVYGSNLSQPTNRAELDSGVEHLLTKACEILPASQVIRGEVRGLINAAHSRRQEARKKVDTSLSRCLEEAKVQKREILLERGQLRLQQNLASRNKHREEIAFGIVSGPEAEKFKSVSEKEDRPLSHVRPQSAAEEQICLQETKTKIARQLSATQLRSSALSASEQRLNRELQQRAKSASFDSQSLQIRRMSLDNRWVS